ncbi:cell division protein ZapE [Nocardia cyriacigeorgica]|uniref:Cell division protein ZapE n=1 Tax=Nocardia cyriacigeorgica TaxID=135487 RepID=A0A5R8NRM0_9NOCA|nr:cell division protein ZapE [Nocardia cyriacigeorgica]TLF78228.1 cell division protein ZapE [Nocardia cyriacigeorgica]
METIRLDADQNRAADALAHLLDRHHRPLKHHRGIYLHGRPGRGKTMVMDRFFATVDPKHKRRFHFHTFFTALHAETHAHGSIDKAIDILLGKARLVCFDEFHVHDIGDAMLITRMLDALFARRLTLVVTSNYAPAELLPNPLFHDLFVPTIERIVAELDVVSLDGPLDYRTIAHGHATGFPAGRFIVGPSPAFGRAAETPGRSVDPAVSVDGRPTQVGRTRGPAVPSRASSRIEPGAAAPGHVSADESRADAAAVHDSPGSTGSRVEVAVGSRTVRALAVDATTITLDFADLCATPTSAADYVDLAERFQTWTLCGVPLLREVPPDWAMRLVNLVDVLYDADRTLTVYAQAPVRELVAGVRAVPDIARAASRLGELSQSEAVAVS